MNEFARTLCVVAFPLGLGCIAPDSSGHEKHVADHDESHHADIDPHERKTRKLGKGPQGGGGAEEEETSETPPGAPQYDPPFDGTPKSTKELEGGLLVEDFEEGEGEGMTNGWALAVHYTGYLENGLVFDSSKKKGKPFTVELGKARVIKAWPMALEGMKVGGKRRIVVPPELGYGDRKAGKIPPGSKLIFTLELVEAFPPVGKPAPESKYAGAPKSSRTIEGGLQIEEFRAGDGPEAKTGDLVLVHYVGKLEADGTEFDNSHPRGEPISFELGSGRVIKGWDMGLEGMKVGGMRKLVIPAPLAYGEKARGKIPANATLVFFVELMQIRPAATWAKGAPQRPHHGR